MEFKDTNLPKDKVVEDAFNVLVALTKEMTVRRGDFARTQVSAFFNGASAYFSRAFEKKEITEDLYNLTKKYTEESYPEKLSLLAKDISELESNEIFSAVSFATCVASAKSATPELVAAALLSTIPYTLQIFLRVSEATKNDAVMKILSDIDNIEKGWQSCDQASPEVKIFYSVTIISSLQKALIELEGNKKASVSGVNMICDIFSNFKPLWGNDSALDLSFIGAFNAVARAGRADVSIGIGPKGEVELNMEYLKESLSKTDPKEGQKSQDKKSSEKKKSCDGPCK